MNNSIACKVLASKEEFLVRFSLFFYSYEIRNLNSFINTIKDY